MKKNLKMKFNLVYESVMKEITESEQMLTEGVMKKLGSAIAAGTLAATAAMTPANVEAAPVKNQQKEIQSNVNEANQLIGYAMRLLKYFEGSVKDSKGNHVVYDDADNKHRWNGKQDINEFIKSCRGKATIGYGETASSIVKKGKISDSEANQLLQKQIVSLNNKLIPKNNKVRCETIPKINVASGKELIIEFGETTPPIKYPSPATKAKIPPVKYNFL